MSLSGKAQRSGTSPISSPAPKSVRTAISARTLSLVPTSPSAIKCKIQKQCQRLQGRHAGGRRLLRPFHGLSPISTIQGQKLGRWIKFAQLSSKKGVTLGANCTIVCGHTIGNYAFYRRRCGGHKGCSGSCFDGKATRPGKYGLSANVAVAWMTRSHVWNAKKRSHTKT